MSLKLSLLLLSITATLALSAQQNVGIGTTNPDPSAALDINSTNKGLLVPRMTTAQRDAIVNPALGLIILNLDDKCVDIYNGTGWIKNCGFSITIDTAAGVWTKKADFGGSGRYGAVGFSIDGKGYMGTGFDIAMRKNFWEYDPSTDAWTQKADFGGVERFMAAGFSIGNKGYVGTGVGAGYYKDFWEYDPSTNTWTQKTDFGGTARGNGIGFSVGNKGYIGTGSVSFGAAGMRRDFWEYDPATNLWTQKADFGGTARQDAEGFGLGTKGYLGTGQDATQRRKDFWEYDPATDIWTPKTDLSGSIRSEAISFVIGSKGFLGGGIDGGRLADFWEYDPSANNWTRIADIGGGGRSSAASFAIGNKAYVGTGQTASQAKDFWQYDPFPTANFYNSNSNNNIASSYYANDGFWIKRADTLLNAFPASATILSTTRMGINTGAPTARLHVNGTFRLVDGTEGIGKVLTADANGTASWQTAPTAIANGSATGNTLYWNGTSWTNSNNIYNNNGNVGIGTSSPGKKLDVNGTMRVNTHFVFNSASGTINWGNAGGLYFRTNNTVGEETTYNEIMVLTSAGRLGINTTNPLARLDVNGNIRITDGTQGNNKVLTSDPSGNASWQNIATQIASGTTTGNTLYWNGTAWTNSANIFNNNGNVGIGIATPAAKLDIAGTLKIADGSQGTNKVLTSDGDGLASWQDIPTQIAAGTAAGNTLYWNGTSWTNSNNIYNNNGNVGIGTASPGRKLDVDGTVRFNTHLIFNSPNAVVNYFGGGNLYFRANTAQGDDNAYSERMILTGAGNLGIGTVSPSNRLSVVGSANITTSLAVGSGTTPVALDVIGGIRTIHSGTFSTGSGSPGSQVINMGIPALPAGWDFTNTVVLVTNADGAIVTIQQAKLTSVTNIQVTCNFVTVGATRFNWVVFKL
jgi:hypothetical protein